MPNRNIEIETLSWEAPNIISIPNEISPLFVRQMPIAQKARIRPDHLGIYPNLYVALRILREASIADGLWQDKPLLTLSQASDKENIWVEVNVVTQDKSAHNNNISVPFTFKARKLKSAQATRTALYGVMAAMKADAPSALEHWKLFPENFSLRKMALEDIQEMCRPARHRKYSPPGPIQT
jgi:hypothetical protein